MTRSASQRSNCGSAGAFFSDLGYAVGLLGTLVVAPCTAGAQVRSLAVSDSVHGLVWRPIGPSKHGGRVEDIAVPVYAKTAGIATGSVMYIAAATGGVFKTTDWGARWTPVFDNEPSAAAHTIAIHPLNPDLVWVGTGDPQPWELTPGTGVYKSLDGGTHWTHCGLDSAVVVSRLVLDPNNQDVAYAAVTGSLAHPGGMRGVYKTTDGGHRWARVLAGPNEWTGAIDLAIDPANPQQVYAVLQQRAHTPEFDIGYGPGSGIYKSTDGGTHWMRLAEGLPQGYYERAAITVSPAQPSTVYAAIISVGDGKNGYAPGWAPMTVYRSDDAGLHWERGTAGHAASWPLRAVADPSDPARMFVMGGQVDVFSDRGRQVRDEEELDGDARTTDGAPGDTHALWVDPQASRHWIVGYDQGVASTYDDGRTWTQVPTLPIGQFRYIDVDRRQPFYWVHGENQDHSGAAGPSRTRNARGIAYTDWIDTPIQESGRVLVDPADPSVLFGQHDGTNFPALVKVTTGEVHPFIVDMHHWAPPPGADAPIIMSSHDRRTLYAGTTQLFRSTDRGEHWLPISPVLLRPARDSLSPPGFDGIRVEAAFWQGISTVAESPLQRGVLYVGTGNGLLHVSRDGGSHWSTSDHFPGASPGTYISNVVASRYEPGTAYLTLTGIEAGDFSPHVLKSVDYGAHWSPLSTAGLPTNAAAWVIVEHFRTRGLLFLGTDVGVFYSTDGGTQWRTLRLNMPAVRVHDLAIQPQANDLVAGTFGRSIWILDDVTPLETIAAAERKPVPTLFSVRSSVLPLPHGGNDVQGQPVALPNPAPAFFAYYVPSQFGHDSVVLRIRERTGRDAETVLRVAGGPGLHRIEWNMLAGSDKEEQSAHQPFRLVPGRYRVHLAIGSWSAETGWMVNPDPLMPVSRVALDTIVAVRHSVSELSRRFWETFRGALRLGAELDSAKVALERAGRPQPLLAESQRLRAALDTVLGMWGAGQLAPDKTDVLSSEDLNGTGLIIENAYRTVSAAATKPPVPVLRSIIEIADKRLSRAERILASVRDVGMPRFRAALGAAGISSPTQ